MFNDFLTSVLKRAVPTVPFTSARISWYRISYIRTSRGDQLATATMYFVDILDESQPLNARSRTVDFWREFKRRYPQWRLTMGRVEPVWFEPYPSFPSAEDLLRWLGDTIDPSGTTTNLLLLLAPRL